MDISETNRHIAENMRYLRHQKRLSQTALARQLGMGLYSLRRLESGDIPSRFTGDRICRICDFFDISADHLLFLDIASADTAK